MTEILIFSAGAIAVLVVVFVMRRLKDRGQDVKAPASSERARRGPRGPRGSEGHGRRPAIEGDERDEQHDTSK